MLRIFCALCLLTISFLSNSSPAAAPKNDAIRIILVGDSTMATRTGYGDAFCALLQIDVACINLARGGRSSGSFRAEGLWDQLTTLLRDNDAAKPVYRATYVLIQFGHNDQPGKPGRSTDLATEFPANMSRYADEVKEAGAIPVLVTPLSRRIFRDGELQNDLQPWAEAIRRVAKTKQALLLDLNAESAAAISRMGSKEADSFAMASPAKFDYTHIGEKGAGYFARMVGRELVQAVPALSAHIKQDK